MSSGPVVLGVDQGLSGARASVMDADGTTLGIGRAPCVDLRGEPGSLEHDPGGWVEETTAAVAMALAEAGLRSVDAIGIGALGPAPVVIDERLRPLAGAPLFPQDLVGVCGRWSRSDPGIAERAAWIVDACGFLVSTLVGRPVMDRITAVDHAEFGDALDTRPVAAEEPFAIAGGLTPDAARRIGLAAGTPVTVGGYDTFVDLAALGVTASGDRGILLGSTLIVGAVRDDDRATDGLRPSRHMGEGWFVGGWTQAAGRALEWWLGLFPADRRLQIAREAAELPPGAGGLLALPYLEGERAPVWDPHARGAFVGLSTGTTAAELFRSMIDSVALSAADLAQRIPREDGAHRWRVAGGGVRVEAWLRATVDAIGEPMTIADIADANGAARSALRAIGSPAPGLATRQIEPDPERHARYEEMLELYRGLYGALSPTVRRLASERRR